MLRQLEDIYATKKTILPFWTWMHMIFNKNLGKTDDEVFSIALELITKYD